LACGRGKTLVAPATRTSFGHHRALSRDEQVPASSREVTLDSFDLGPRGYPHEQRLTVGTVAQRAFSVAAATGSVMRLASEALQVA
jgi:hypothetical protein